MSDGAGPFLTVLWGHAQRVRRSPWLTLVRTVARNGASERYAARMAWPWDADLDGITWDWPKRSN